MAEVTLAKFGVINILVNCAGGPASARSLFCESEDKVWDHIIGLNLKEVHNCTREVINHMIDR